jgi:pimeloyl-ACP methyl ester carboxylesterase
MDERQVTLRNGDFKTQLFQAGRGEPLLFLHGANGLDRARYLDALAENFTLYAPVHPGFGESDGLDHIDDVIDFALYYHELMDELGVESAHVVGHSLGGMLAAELAALCPHRVRRLVLSNPAGLWRDDAPTLDFFAVLPDKLLPAVFHNPESDAVREAIKMPDSQDAMIEAMYRRIQSLTAAGKFLWPIPDRGLERRLYRIKASTLIIWGESDGVVPPVYAEAFQSNIKNARVVILKEAAHMPMIEKPDEFVSLVTEFLQGA